MVMRLRPAALAATLMLGATATGLGCRPAVLPPSAPSPLLMNSMPDFGRPTLSHGRIETKQLRGQLVVVKFFAKYCEPCKKTLPAAQRLHQKYADVAFIGISEDERQGDADALVQGYGLSFPVVMDRGNILSGRYRVREMPVTFLVDGEGTIRWVGGPGQAEGALEQAIRAVRGG